MRLSGLIIAAVLTAVAAPALAAPPDCHWNNLTPQTRAALLEAYKTRAEGAFGAVRPTAADEQALKAACGMTAANMLEALGALKMATIEHGAAAALKAERGIDEARLDQAWKAMPPADRDAILAAAVGAVEGDDDTGTADEAITRFMEGLGLPLETQGPNQGFYWLRAHAMRLVYENRPAR
jgi:hypothetical protein